MVVIWGTGAGEEHDGVGRAPESGPVGHIPGPGTGCGRLHRPPGILSGGDSWS